MAHAEYITVVCDVCGTRMTAFADQAGQTIECPDCFTKAVVQRPKTPPALRKHVPAVQIDEDEYRLCEGVDQPKPGSRAYQKYVPVVCPVCGTRMLATLEQVGRPIVCPDCTLPTTVPPPPEQRPRPRHVVVVQDNEYRVFGVDQPPPAGVYIAVVCTVCGTRMHAPEDQAGKRIACPDCGTNEVVPAAAQRVKIDPMAGAGEGYRVGEPVRPPEVRVGIDYRTEEPGRGELPSDRARWWRPEEPRPRPRWTFFSGVFTFPWYRGSLGCWMGISGGWLVLALLASSANALAAVPSPPTYIASMAITGVTFALGLVVFVVVSAYLLAILRDTAVGFDAVENWPDAVFLDWLGESMYVLSALAFSVVPGAGADRLLHALGRPNPWCVPLSMMLAFPVLLVSMLETNSPLKPISLPVLGSLFRRWWAWGLFWIESAAVALAADLLAMGLASALGTAGGLLGVPLLASAAMVYFRLLGRLTWLISGAGEEWKGEGPGAPPEA